MADSNFLAGNSSMWVQPDGPNTKPVYLGQHSVGDLTEPLGDETITYKPDPAASGRYVPKNSYTGQPGSVTVTIETDMRKTADYLEGLANCVVPVYFHKVLCGRRDVFSNFDRTFAMMARVTQRTIGNFISKSATDENETTQSFALASKALLRFFNLQASRVSIAETEDVTGITIGGEERCAGACGAASKLTDTMFAATKALTGSATNKANVLKSLNSAAWTATSSDPFTGGEDIQGIVSFKVGKTTTRVLVARGTTDVAAPAEVAYSDDAGVTWFTKNVGSTNGEYVSNGHALFALDQYHIWLGTDGGRIYFSNDGGITWTVQENATISATDVVGISFYDTDIGFAVYTGGEVAKTSDGSSSTASWTATTVSGSTAAMDIATISQYSVWVAGTDGLFYTSDAGSTWASRASYAVAAVDFYSELMGVAVGSATSGLIYYTVNGGYDWTTLTLLSNAGYLDVDIVDNKLAYITGKASGGTGMIAKLIPVEV